MIYSPYFFPKTEHITLSTKSNELLYDEIYPTNFQFLSVDKKQKIYKLKFSFHVFSYNNYIYFCCKE